MKLKPFIVVYFLSLGLLKAQTISTLAGDGTAAYAGDGGQCTAAELNYPIGVVLDASGNLYIADMQNNRVRKISTTGIITTVAGIGTAGHAGDGGQATAAKLYYPTGLAFDAIGNLYIADYYNNRVRKVTTTGIITTVAGYTVDGGYSGDGGPATAAQLNSPVAIAFDGANNMYIADESNNCIRMVNTAGIISTFAGDTTAGYAGDGGAATDAELYFPSGVACDALGNVYISDYDNNRVRMVNTSGIISTFAGTGTGAYSGDGGQAISAEIYNPWGITCDALGNVYIADYGNNRIRMVNASGIITTIVGNGTLGFSGDGGLATMAELNRPSGVTFDTANNVYIVDRFNNRVRKVTPGGQTTGIEQNNVMQVSVYPNPTSGNFIIETNTTDKQLMNLYDINGSLVLSKIINDKSVIDVANLNRGIYNITIINNKGTVNKKLVVM
ncbi:MAG TPA: T9SS type A sorting domain-containing protein [Bacteroidia bacterium]|nr:T9SS type A sorting domain-containing protein [Bacteroidia bacterium]